MSLITNRIGAPAVYVQAKEAQATLREVLNSVRNASEAKSAVYAFEDTLNGLSGEILNLAPELQSELQLENASLIELGASKGVVITLHESVLPKASASDETDTTTTVTAKRLFPRTETVTIQSSTQSSESSGVPVSSSNTTVPLVLGYVESELVTGETVDEVFEELDTEIEDVVQEPLATEQNETIPYLPDGMVTLAKAAAANANGLQAGLVEFSKNPLAPLIADARSTLIYYTEGNYANLNTAVSGVSTDINLAAEYKKLRDAIGGADGLAGCVSQLDHFKDHTDRISGLVLDENSPNSEPTDDSLTEDLTLYGFSGGPTVIFSFNAKKFRSAKYLVQATAADGDRAHQATDLYILHDNYHAYSREIAAIYTQDPFITYTTRLLNGNVEVLATSNVANVDFVIHGSRLQIARASKSYSEMSQVRIIENHELLAVYLDDGVDYVQRQSASLLKSFLIANLMREFRDMLVNLDNAAFLTQSTANKQAGLLAYAAIIETRRAEIQAAIEEDYRNFLEVRRLAEALDIAYNLTVAYTDENGNAIPKVTLNNAAIAAIEEATP